MHVYLPNLATELFILGSYHPLEFGHMSRFRSSAWNCLASDLEDHVVKPGKEVVRQDNERYKEYP